MAINNFKIEILPRAKEEINEVTAYYNSKQKDLGKIFYIEFKEYISTLKKIPYFEVKYNIVRTLTLKKFPYTIHFSVNEFESIVYILAISNNYQNPKNTRIKF